jgi:hypothetical protein
MRTVYRHGQQGYFLILAVVFILVIGVMGSLMSYILANRAMLSVAQLNGLKSFYMAESGLEIGTRLLTMPVLTGTPGRIACGSLTGTAAVTNAALGSGTFTLTTFNSSPVYATTTLNAAETSSDTVMNVTSTVGFAPSGRILVDQEAIDYAAISGNTFIGVTRGMAGTLASSHVSGAGVSQYQCSIDSQAGIPNLTSPSYKNEVQTNVQLQDGFAVGALSSTNFVTTRWNRPTEKGWTTTNVAGGSNVANLNGVSMVNSADGWAVGNAANRNLIYLRWTGSAWSVSTIGNSCGSSNIQHLLGVSMVSSRQGFAVGAQYRIGGATCGSGNYRYLITYWNGTTWSILTPSTSPQSAPDGTTSANSAPTLNAVHVIDTNGDGLADVGFAVGNRGVILKYDGTNWIISSGQGVLTTQNLTGVYTVSASEAWAVGAAGLIYKWNGSTWSSFASPTAVALNEVAMLDTNGDGLAEFGIGVGTSGRIITYNGSTWSTTTAGASNLFGIDILDSQDAMAVGAAGTIQRWNGTTWSSIASGTAVQLNGVSFIAPHKQPTAAWEQIFH